MSNDPVLKIQTVREQFRVQVVRFEESVGGVSNAAIGAWIPERLELTRHEPQINIATDTIAMLPKAQEAPQAPRSPKARQAPTDPNGPRASYL